MSAKPKGFPEALINQLKALIAEYSQETVKDAIHSLTRTRRGRPQAEIPDAALQVWRMVELEKKRRMEAGMKTTSVRAICDRLFRDGFDFIMAIPGGNPKVIRHITTARARALYQEIQAAFNDPVQRVYRDFLRNSILGEPQSPFFRMGWMPQKPPTNVAPHGAKNKQ